MTASHSALLLAPQELRNEIFSYLLPGHFHIGLHDGCFRLANCLEPRVDIAPSNRTHIVVMSQDPLLRDEYKYMSWRDGSQRPLWADRLASTWGNHWRCKEGVVRGDPESSSGFEMFLVCRQIRQEALDFVVRSSEGHICDLDTIHHLGNPSHAALLDPDTLTFSLQRLTNLTLTLRLPLAFWTSFDHLWDTHPGRNKAGLKLAPLHQSWQTLGTSLIHLPNLHILRLWLDHERPDSWATIDERAAFAPLANLIRMAHFETTVSLPHLHPRLQDASRHFTSQTHVTGSDDGFTIDRRVRQRCFKGDVERGEEVVVEKPGFPFLLDIVDTVDWKMVDIERAERKAWEAGTDVEAEVKAILGIPLGCSGV